MAVLKAKSKGKDVIELQKALNKAVSSKLDLDGQFGKQTEAAVKKFQKKNKLKPDGVAGMNTLAKLGVGPGPKMPKMRVEDCRAKLASWKRGLKTQGVGGPTQINNELVHVRKALKDIEKQFLLMGKETQTIQKDVDKNEERVLELLEEIVKHQEAYTQWVKDKDVQGVTEMADGADYLYGQYQKHLGLFDAAREKQKKMFTQRFIPLVDKALS
ncbi:MAG: peptidoglycan-binding domain-containing protein [Aliishimia sp.]